MIQGSSKFAHLARRNSKTSYYNGVADATQQGTLLLSKVNYIQMEKGLENKLSKLTMLMHI